VRLGTDGAAGRKPSDNYAVPLCSCCHAKQHAIAEGIFWASAMAFGITDPWSVAKRLYKISGDIEAGYRTIQHDRPGLLTAGMT
jgi:hypothetical protein